jgi:hypothetical protein
MNLLHFTPYAVGGAVALGLLTLAVSALARRLRRIKATRVQLATWGLAVPAAMALAMSASTSYRFFDRVLDVTDLGERLGMCGIGEATIIGVTIHAWAAKSKSSAWAVYALVGVQAILAFEVTGGAGGVVRTVLGPVLLAYLLHRLLGIETKFSGKQSTGLLASLGREIKERLTALLGIGRRGEDSAAIARSRASDRAVRLATRKRWSGRKHDRLGKAIDAAQHGLDEADAAEAEAAIVARIVRRNSVTALRLLEAEHVWSTTAVSAPVTAPVEIIPADNSTDNTPPVEPVVWVRNRGLVSGRKSLRTASRTLRKARTVQGPRMGVQQPEQAPAGGQNPDTPPVQTVIVQEPKKRVDASVAVPAMHAMFPDMGPDTIALKLGIHERTARRYLSAKDHLVQHANGTDS